MALNFDPDHDYTADEHLRIVLTDYHVQKKEYDNGQREVPPKVAVLARLYAIKEPTLRGHIKNPLQKTLFELHHDQQLLSKEEESELLKRALFMDDFNLPPDRETLEQLALTLIRQRNSMQTRIGQHWIH